MESGNQTPRAARLALIGAVAILLATIGYQAFRPTAGAPKAEAAQHVLTVETLEDQLKASPRDPKLWAQLGEALFGRSEFADAAAAYERAVALDDAASNYWSALGEARVMASARDPMPPPALDAFRRAAALDSKDPRARYFLAIAKDLAKDHEGAIADWLALLADTPPGAPWEQDLRRTIVQAGKVNHIEVETRLAKVHQPAPATAGGAMPGPSADQIRAASALTPGQQEEMGRGMVERLEARLEADPKNPDGWVMLMRSRMALGETAKAQAALKDAVAANPGAKTELEAQARALGVPR